MSGSKSRSKGQRGEREVVALVARLWTAARRGWQSRFGSDEPDVCGTPYWIECKRGRRTNIHAAIWQADAATDGRPVLVWTRRDSEGWLVTMHASDWLELAARAEEKEGK